MAFNDVRFPVGISYGSSGGPGFNTNIVELDSGATTRVSRWNGARHKYNAAHAIKSLTDLSAVKDFYMANRGAAIGFRYKDWFDYTSTIDGRVPPFGLTTVSFLDQVIGAGDGTKTTFQLIKKYVSGAQTQVRNITKPVDGTVLVAKDSVNQTSGWTVNTLTGIVTFTTAPAIGVVISAGFEFDVPVRFGRALDDVFDASVDSFGSGSIDIPLIEEIEAGGIEDEFNYRGATEKVFGANMTLSVNHGSLVVLNASTTSLVVTLPDPTSLPPGGPYFFVVNGGSNSFTLKDHNAVTLVTLTSGNGAVVVLTVNASGTKIWYTI